MLERRASEVSGRTWAPLQPRPNHQQTHIKASSAGLARLFVSLECFSNWKWVFF